MTNFASYNVQYVSCRLVNIRPSLLIWCVCQNFCLLFTSIIENKQIFLPFSGTANKLSVIFVPRWLYFVLYSYLWSGQTVIAAQHEKDREGNRKEVALIIQARSKERPGWMVKWPLWNFLTEMNSACVKIYSQSGGYSIRGLSTVHLGRSSCT